MKVTQILSEIKHMQHNDFSELHICGEGTEVINSPAILMR